MWGWDIFHFRVFILPSDCWKEKYIKYSIFYYTLSCEKRRKNFFWLKWKKYSFIHVSYQQLFISPTFLHGWSWRVHRIWKCYEKIRNSSLNVWFLAKCFGILILDINIMVHLMVSVEVVKNIELYFHLPQVF